MQTHPFIEQLRYRAFAILVLCLALLIQVSLSLYYGEGTLLLVALDSLASTIVFAVLGYFAWYTVSLLDKIYKQIGIILLVVLLCLSTSHLIFSSISPERTAWFLRSIPLRVLSTVLCWIILFQWYRWYLNFSETEEGTDNVLDRYPDPDEDIRDGLVLDRISVKDGTKIHLITPEKLVYIQASGDYVTLFTEAGQYVKEQTMKSIISQLPSDFIRIHRSTIVNCDYIARIELYEKQSYRLRLKNGVYLRTSITGYKLLKERLLI